MLWEMSRFRFQPFLVVFAWLFLQPAAEAYRIATFDGREIDAAAIVPLDEGFLVRTDEGSIELPPGSIDFYATFRINLEGSPGNALAFKRGGFLRFESIDFERGKITVDLDEGLSFTVPESVIDFRKSVLEGSLLELPADYGPDAAVAKSRGRAASTPARRFPTRRR